MTNDALDFPLTREERIEHLLHRGDAHAADDTTLVSDLSAEVRRLRAQDAQLIHELGLLGVTVHRYTDSVSMLPVTAVHGATIADVLTAQSALAAVSELRNRAEHGALRWAEPLPVPEWVKRVRTAVTLAGNLNAFDVSRQHLTGAAIAESATALEKTDTNIPRHHVTAVADWLRDRARTATSGKLKWPPRPSTGTPSGRSSKAATSSAGAVTALARRPARSRSCASGR